MPRVNTQESVLLHKCRMVKKGLIEPVEHVVGISLPAEVLKQCDN
jgi:hypothetical protein